MEIISIIEKDCQSRQFGSLTIITSTITFSAIAIILLFSSYFATLYAQTPVPPVTIEGKMCMYLVTLYGDSLQEIDHYRRTHKEGECITFILKTDKPVDMTPYLSQDEIEFLSDNGSIWQSEFMVVPDWEMFESFSYEAFAAQFAHKRVRVIGELFCPMAGWQNATLVRMNFTKVELVE